MGEKCTIDSTRECQNSTRMALLEKRVEDLEEGQNREERFRKDYYAEREERNLREARLDTKIDGIDAKVTKLVLQQEERDSKPNKLIDKLKDRAAEWILIAVLAFLAVKLGLNV